MIRSLLRSSLTSIITAPKTLILTLHPYSSCPKTPFFHRKKKAPTRPPLPASALAASISRLPTNFTPADLTAALDATPDPRLCLHLLSWASSHPRSLPSPVAFLSTIKKLAAAALYPEMHSAATLAASLPLPPSERLLNTTIFYYAKAGMLSHAVGVYKRALASPDPDPAARPTLRTYNLLFTALLRCGPNSHINHFYMNTARLLFRHMVDAGIAPGARVLNAMIRGYIGSLHLNDALRLFHQMEPVYGVLPDVNTYSALVQGLCVQGRTRNALELWGESRGKGMVPLRKAGNSLACALAMGGEVEEAVGVVWEMVGMRQVADRLTFQTVLEEMCRAERVKEALELLQELRDKKVVDGQIYRELLHRIEDDYGAG